MATLLVLLLAGCMQGSPTGQQGAASEPEAGPTERTLPVPPLNATTVQRLADPAPAPQSTPDNATDAPAEATPEPAPSTNGTANGTPNTTVTAAFYESGTFEVRTEQDGLQRRFIHYVPPGLEVGEPAPLLVLLHGGTGTPENMIWKTGMQGLADANGFRILAPEATPNANGEPRWQAWPSHGFTDHPIDDPLFIAQAVTWLQGQADINASRIGVAGHSEGGSMAYSMGGNYPELFRFIAPVSGFIGQRDLPARPWHNITTPSSPVNALIIHALDDPQIPYEGGRGQLDPWVTKASVADGIALFTGALGYTIDSWVEEDGLRVETYRSMSSDHRVVHVRTEGGHGWPAGLESTTFPYNLLVGTPALPDASALVAQWLVGDLP